MNWSRGLGMGVLVLGAVLLLTGCSGRKEVAIANKDATIARQEQLLEQEKGERDTLSTLNSQLADQNKQLAEKNAALATQNLAKTDELSLAVKQLGDKFAQGGAVKEGDAGAVGYGNDKAIHIKVAGTQLFGPGQAELLSSGTLPLKKVASLLKSTYGKNYVRIEGHTDSTPIVRTKEKFKDNMALSLARAQAVYAYLVKQGIPSSRLYTAGYGEQQPLVWPEKTAADRAKNRRVEIVIMPNDVSVKKEPLAMSTKGKTSAKKK
jgi:chemotaxis protein MotB